MREQRTLFDLTQDGLVIGQKLQRLYPEFNVPAFVADVRTEMEGQTIYNVTKAIGRVLRNHLPHDYPEAGYATLERWNQDGRAETKKILRRALKYQVKIGDERAFKLLGLGAVPQLGKADITLIELIPERRTLPINAPFRFAFSLQSESDTEQTILTYYAVAYKRPSGHITRKRYRLSQRKLKPRQRVDYEKSLFPLPSLKQHHDGKACLGWHRFELEVNGDVLEGFDFEVAPPKERNEI